MVKYPFYILMCISSSLFAQKGEVQIDDLVNNFSQINSKLVEGPLTQEEKQNLQKLLPLDLEKERANSKWGRISFFNSTEQDREYVLRLSRDFGAKRIVAYAITDGQLINTYKTSGFLSSLPKDIEFQHDLCISILLPRKKLTLLYLESYSVEGYSPFFDLELLSVWEWHNQVTRNLAFQSMFHGILWVLLAYSFILYSQTRDRTFLYYSIYLLSFSGFSAIIFNQVGLVVDLPNRPFFFVIFGQSINIFYFLFLKHFASISEISKKWNQLINQVVAALTVTGVVGLLHTLLFEDSVLFVDVLTSVTAVLSFIMIVAIAILSMVKGSNVMKYVGLGTLAMVTGMVISSVYMLLFLDQTTVYGQVGVLIEALIFAMGLGYKMKLKQEESKFMQEQLISQLKQNEELQISMNYELERMVAESTEEVLYQKGEIEVKARLLEEQNASLNKASSFKDRLFAIIGHDLRNPIKSLKGILDMHTRGQLKQQELEIFISKVHKSLNRVISLLDNVLMWALQQMDHIDYQPTRISIQSLVQDNIELLAPLAIEKQIDLVNQVDPKLEASADSEMIKLVIRNILSNAIKFSNRGESIEIMGSDENETILLHVSDKGTGIPPDSLDKLFDDVVYSTYGTAHEKGTGLGLSLCNEFIKKNNGFIYVESELGKGSTFTIELPTKNLKLTA